MSERVSECVCVCVCVCERERESVHVCECEWANPRRMYVHAFVQGGLYSCMAITFKLKVQQLQNNIDSS